MTSNEPPPVLDYLPKRRPRRRRGWRRFAPWGRPRVAGALVITLALIGVVIRAAMPTAEETDVSQGLFLMLNSQDVTSEVFSCPSVQPSHWDFGGGSNTALNWSNWSAVASTQPAP